MKGRFIIWRRSQRIGLALVLALIFAGCGKHSGTAESFGGGDPLMSSLQGLRAQLSVAAATIAQKTPADLCSATSIAAVFPGYFDDHQRPGVDMQLLCIQFFTQYAKDLLKIALDTQGSPLSEDQTTLDVVISGVSTDVVARTPIGQTGVIVFDPQRASTYSAHVLGALLGHEIVHQLKIAFDSSTGQWTTGNGLHDGVTLDGYATPLDYLGASWMTVAYQQNQGPGLAECWTRFFLKQSLGAEPDTLTYSALVGEASVGNLSRHDIARQYFHSDPYRLAHGAQVFERLTGNAPTDSEKATLLRAYTSESALWESIGMQTVPGANDRDTVQRAYQIYFNRVPSAAETAPYVANLPQNGVSWLVDTLVTSNEFRSNFIQDLYQRYLLRTGSDDEISGWVRGVHFIESDRSLDPLIEVAAQIAGSPEALVVSSSVCSASSNANP